MYKNKVKDTSDKKKCEFSNKLLIILCVTTVIFLKASLCVILLTMLKIYFLDCGDVKIVWRNLSSVLHFNIFDFIDI